MAWSNVEPTEAVVTVEEVQVIGDQIRISGTTDPAWVGPAEEAGVSIGNRDRVVQAVEYGVEGYFALELNAEVSHAVTMRVSLGEAWVVIEVLNE
ncbi:hypothetical protein ACFVWR_07100 [Leifsonia sp. NPDC058292]|uniref:hypothetical protein n=1 Tax=Leifsonia sp. NPDC058292 TaxID=3346428 RepID=UPI0036DE800E